MARRLTYLTSPWVLILVVSVALFTFWGGPVFTAPSLSHGGRLLVSYLFIPVAVCVVLLWQRRWEWSSFGYYTVGLALVKMVITMTVFLWVVPRGERLEAVALPAPRETVAHYQGDERQEFGAVVGYVQTPSGPARGFVALTSVKSGKVPQASVRRVGLSPAGFAPAFLVATVHDEIQPASLDTVPHVFVLSDSMGQVVQIPLPPGRSGRSRPLARTGFFEGRCSFDHPNERLPVWVFEHPYHAVLDAAGYFRLDSVPVGTFHLGMWSPADGSSPAQVREIRVSSGGIDTVSLRLEAAAAPGE